MKLKNSLRGIPSGVHGLSQPWLQCFLLRHKASQDVLQLFHDNVRFITDDGTAHHIPRWHFIIDHPPCTYLTRAGSVCMVKNGVVDQDRFAKMLEAREFFFKCLGAPADFLAVENPIPMKRAGLPRPSCYLHPSWFGVKYTKKTLYWLRNLPPIMAEIDHPRPKEFVRASRGHYRSRTFPQVAAALARQWGDYILDNL